MVKKMLTNQNCGITTGVDAKENEIILEQIVRARKTRAATVTVRVMNFGKKVNVEYSEKVK